MVMPWRVWLAVALCGLGSCTVERRLGELSFPRRRLGEASSSMRVIKGGRRRPRWRRLSPGEERILGVRTRGGSEAPPPVWTAVRRYVSDLGRTAPAVRAVVFAAVFAYVGAQLVGDERRFLRDHAVCCLSAVRRGRYHAVLSHALVHPAPLALVLNVASLLLAARRVEEALGTRRFAVLLLATTLGSAAATLAAQIAGARGGVVGLSGTIYGVTAVLVAADPDRLVSFAFLAPAPAKYLAALVLAFDFLLLLSGHPGAASHLGGAAAGVLFHCVSQSRRRNHHHHHHHHQRRAASRPLPPKARPHPCQYYGPPPSGGFPPPPTFLVPQPGSSDSASTPATPPSLFER